MKELVWWEILDKPLPIVQKRATNCGMALSRVGTPEYKGLPPSTLFQNRFKEREMLSIAVGAQDLERKSIFQIGKIMMRRDARPVRRKGKIPPVNIEQWCFSSLPWHC
jgi:hypothetical protein